MLDRIMRSLGYVPQVVLTDVHNYSVRVDTDLAAARLEIDRLRKDAERATRYHNEIMNTKNATIDDLREAYKHLEKLNAGARLVSVYVFADKPAKQVRLMLAGITKGGESVAVPIRNLMLSGKNTETLKTECEALAAAFGAANTSVASLT